MGTFVVGNHKVLELGTRVAHQAPCRRSLPFGASIGRKIPTTCAMQKGFSATDCRHDVIHICNQHSLTRLECPAHAVFLFAPFTRSHPSFLSLSLGLADVERREGKEETGSLV